MTKKEKLIERIKTAKVVDFEDVDLLLKQLGFSRRVEGSHHTYVNAPYVIVIAVHGKQLKRVYLKNVQDLLSRWGINPFCRMIRRM
ncbi:hypothetical protein P378_20140 [Desulforamulus profundi]|uniref:Toxin HicA n=1 Tax=Desulforamulus profundi TaxID=1383067 RepID=A0A2C6M9V8_9FIRM|nr:type II toxin-antitoxin system HicA family toxin [Desulforamulus profundi]PHJ36768.1 hypothetical protein P378_20140 [Desulforamulus profundi]